MTDRAALSAITHGERPFHQPIPAERVDALVATLGLTPQDRVVDVGCGPGELLLRIAERHGAAGLGVDLAAVQIERARALAAARAPGAALEFEVADAGALDVEPGTFALAACIASTHALGGLEPAIARLAELARPGGWVLVGDGYWRRPPGDVYLDILGATAGELPDYAGLVRAGEAAGLRSVAAIAATQEEWDAYEWTLIGNGERWLAEHADAAHAPALRAWVDAARDRYLAPGGRETLGFAVVLWRRALDA